jgi:cation transport ATPase
VLAAVVGVMGLGWFFLGPAGPVRLTVDEQIVIRSGEKTPVDATVLSSSSAGHESMLTGEPTPVTELAETP